MKSQRITLVFNCDLGYPRGVLRGIKQFADATQQWVLVLHDATGVTRQTLESIGGHGLIANVMNERLMQAISSLGLPVVNVSPVLKDTPFPRVMVDRREIGQLAFQHLWERGIRNFGFVGHPRHLYSTEREGGFRTALDPHPVTFSRYHEHPNTSFHHRAHLLALRPDFQNWLRGLPKPVGIFACHDVWGVQVLNACRLMDLCVPDEVAVVGVDNDDLLCRLTQPSLSSIIVPAEQIGYQAGAMLAALFKSKSGTARQWLIPAGGVVARQSTDILAGGDATVAAALRLIREHGRTFQRVTDILNQLVVSRRSLEKRFMAVLGHGIGEEIRRARAERAKFLLANSTLSVAEVAEQAGYSSMHYLARSMRRECGQTPTEYRSQFRIGSQAQRVTPSRASTDLRKGTRPRVARERTAPMGRDRRAAAR